MPIPNKLVDRVMWWISGKATTQTLARPARGAVRVFTRQAWPLMESPLPIRKSPHVGVIRLGLAEAIRVTLAEYRDTWDPEERDNLVVQLTDKVRARQKDRKRKQDAERRSTKSDGNAAILARRKEGNLEKEMASASRWLTRHRHLFDIVPYEDVIRDRVRHMLPPGKHTHFRADGRWWSHRGAWLLARERYNRMAIQLSAAILILGNRVQGEREAVEAQRRRPVTKRNAMNLTALRDAVNARRTGV